MSTTTESQIESIRAMMASGHRSVRMERHSLLLWGLTAAFLILTVDAIFTLERFPVIWQLIATSNVYIAVILFVVGFIDYKLTRRTRWERGESLSFVQIQLTKVWWLLIGLIVALNLGMGFFGGGYMIYGAVLVLVGLALYVQGLFSQQMLSWAGVLLILMGLVSVGLQLPWPAMKWLTASALGLGIPLLILIQNRPETHATVLRRLLLSASWLLLIIMPAILAYQISLQMDVPDTKPISLKTYLSQPAGSDTGKQVVRIPAGTTIPVKVSISGNLLENTDVDSFSMRLSKQLDVVVEDGNPEGHYRIAGGDWQDFLGSIKIRVEDLGSSLDPNRGPAVSLKLNIDTLN